MRFDSRLKLVAIAASIIALPLFTVQSIYAANTPDFIITAAPSTLTVQPGIAQNVTVTVVSLNGFSSPVALTSSPGITGVSQTFVANSVTPVPNGAISTQLTILANSSATMKGTMVTITGTSASPSLRHNASPVKVFVNCVQFIMQDINTGQILTEHQVIHQHDNVTDTAKLTCNGVFAGAMLTSTTHAGDPSIQIASSTSFVIEFPAGAAPASVTSSPYEVFATSTGGKNTYNNNMLLNGPTPDAFFVGLTPDNPPRTGNLHFHVVSP